MDAVARSGDAKGEGDGVRDGAGRVVGAKGNVVGVADGGDPAHAGDAAGVGCVGLEVVAGAQLDRVQDLLGGVEALAAGDGDAHAAAQVGERAHGVGDDGLLHPVGVELLERAADAERGGEVEPAVALDEDLRLAGGRGLDCGNALQRLAEVVGRKLAVVAAERIPLESAEAGLDRGHCLVGELLGLLRAGKPAVGVAGDAIAALAAGELPDR